MQLLVNRLLYNSSKIRLLHSLVNCLLIFLFFFIIIKLICIKSDGRKSNALSEEHYKLFQEFIKELRDVSGIQKLVSVETLITTLKFVIQDVDEYDPALVDFFRSQIKLPSDRSKLRLNEMSRREFSQIGFSQKRQLPEQERERLLHRSGRLRRRMLIEHALFRAKPELDGHSN